MPLRPSHLAGLGLPALLLAAVLPGQARAAQSYDNCTGFIDALPAIITSPGTWCLRKDLNTAAWQGDAILIVAHDVTLDCNHHKIGGLGAGAGTQAIGVHGMQRDFLRVRRCNIRGFATGIHLGPGHGLRIEDNRLDSNTITGIHAQGYDGVVARNLVRDTGGSTSYRGYATGIRVWNSMDVLDNTVSGVMPLMGDGESAYATGIEVSQAQSNRVAGNRVRRLVALGATKPAVALSVQSGTKLAVYENEFVGPATGAAVQCTSTGDQARVQDNILGGFPEGVKLCTDGGNDYTP
jgi:hypothetical protein